MRIEICCKEGESLLQACQRLKIFSNNVCGGAGICGKCKVRMITNAVPPSGADQVFFTERELQAGWRLACLAKLVGSCKIEIPLTHQEDMSVVTDSGLVNLISNKEDDRKENGEKTKGMALVIDIGTTTIAMQLVRYGQNLQGESEIEVIDTYTAVNSQRSYGADVISRIQASNQGKGQELKECILHTLAEGMETLLSHTRVEQVLIAGNTTMVHLFMGYSCETLGSAPFRPVTTDCIQVDAGSVFSSYLSKETSLCLKDARMYIFPGISAFVGGDIVAGMYITGFYKKQEVQLLIDLGTNGEMVIGNRMRMLATSTAAGPAFEGGGLSCGCAGIKGAICGAKLLQDGTWELTTISDAEPVGICGSGIIEVLYELLINGWIDETGLLAEGNLDRVDLAGNKVYITQQDIRQFQMAKGAVRAGIETLMREYGAEVEDISQIYIAGGFGYFLNLQKAAAIGLFPAGFSPKMCAIGNSSLAGLKGFMTERDEGKLLNLRKYTTDCNLAENAYFKEMYLEYMYFPEMDKQ